jgi:hypothetical protein
MDKKLKALGDHLQRLRSEGGSAMLAFFIRHVRGHIQYYGVSVNSRALAGYLCAATGLLFKWLNRRSQHRLLTWKRFTAYIRPMSPRARIVHDLSPIPWWCAFRRT